MAADEAEDKVPINFVIKVYETKELAEEGNDNNALYIFDNGIDNDAGTVSDPTVSNGSQFVQGVATTNTSGKLISSASLFGSRLASKIVHNDTDGTTGTINSDGVDSTTQLTLAADTFPDGNENYHIEAPGHYFIYQKYFYRLESTEVVKGFIIDWDDGEDNSPEKANRQTVLLDSPNNFAIVEHTYTKHGKFYPMIRTISIDGFYSKWYTSWDRLSLSRTKSIETQTLGAGQNDFSIVSLDVTQARGTLPRIPEFAPANMPPTAVLNVDRKAVFAGIDNDVISGNAIGYCFVPRAADTLTSYTSAVEVIYKTTLDVIMKETIGASSVLKDTNCEFPTSGLIATVGYLKEVLSVKIIKLAEGLITDTNKLGPDERLHVMYTTGTAAGTDDVITTLSLGNSIQTLDRPGFSLLADGSQSQTRAGNVTIDKYIFDTGKLNNYSTSTAPYYNINLEQISDAIGAAQGAANTADQDSSNLVVHYNWKFNKILGTSGAGRVFKESHVIDSTTKRFYDFERLILLQVQDSSSDTRHDGATFYDTTNQQDSTTELDGAVADAVTTTIDVDDGTVFDVGDVIAVDEEFMLVQSISSDELTVTRGYQSTTAAAQDDAATVYILTNNGKYGDSIDHSRVEHWDSTTYYDDLNRPTSLKSRGLLLYANSSLIDNLGTPGSEQWSNRMQHNSTNYSNFSSDTDAAGDTALVFGGRKRAATATNKTQLSSMSAGHTTRPTNYLLCAQTDKFNKLFMRMSNTIGWKASAATAIESDDLYAHSNNITAWYTARTAKTDNSYEWKPLPINDGTATKGDGTSLRKSGTIYFDLPDDWVKVRSGDLSWHDANKPIDDDLSGTEDPHDLWNYTNSSNIVEKDMYGLLIGMGCTSDVITQVEDINCNYVFPCNNSHSAIIKVIDPHHKSLNDIAIAQSVSWNRKGNFINITDRLGRSELRRIGASGGGLRFGGVELKGDYATQKKLLNIYQREGTPVYLDIERAVSSGEFIRFFGVITSMSEDYPVGHQYPKFGITMGVEYVLEYDSNGAPIGDGYLMSLGGEIIDEPKYLL